MPNVNRSSLSVLSLVVFALLALVSAFPCGAAAQQGSKKTEDLESLLQERMSAPVVQPSGTAMESVVDPAQYYVGPSDVILVNIWMSPPLSFALTVTPEGSLVIPTVGEVPVVNLTLAQAKEKILREVRRKYLLADITATLSKPRQILVSVSGTVLNPGTYTVSGVDRANKAIDEANKLSKMQTPDDVVMIKRYMSTRNVVVQHRDGSESRVDIEKYFATKDNKQNPYLREGDVVVVPRRDPLKNVIGVYGEVNAPGRFEFVEGDSLLDALRIAHGATGRAILDKALFSRLGLDGTTIKTHVVNLPAMIAGAEPNPPLEPGDRLVLQAKIDLRGDFNADLKGEVRYPGTYPITRNQTHLSEVIRQAGGFTDNAALSSAVVIRQSVSDEEIPDEQMISMRGVVSTQDTLGYTLETSLRISREAVTVDFVKLFVQGDSTQDIVLQAEDQIVIPKQQSTVYVFGQVSSPGHISFVGKEDPEYYIAKAGGYSDRASKDDVKIIKAKTKQWLESGDTSIEPGDYIWVPAEPDHPTSYYMTIASQAASVLSVVIGVAVLLVQVSK